MKSILFLFTVSLLLANSLVLLAQEQKEKGDNGVEKILIGKNSTLEEYYKALEIFEKAKKAAGGIEKLDRLSKISYSLDGFAIAIFQGPGPDSLHRPLPRKGKVVSDIDHNLFYNSLETKWPNFSSRTTLLARDDTVFSLNQQHKTYRNIPSSTTPKIWNNRISLFLLKKIERERSALRYKGQASINGKEYEVLSAIMDQKSANVYLDKVTFLLHKIEYLEDFPYLGDVITSMQYSDYEEVNGLKIASRFKAFSQNILIDDYEFTDIKTAESVDTMSLSIPSDFKLHEEERAVTEMKTKTLAPNIHLVQNIDGRDYNSLFIDLGEHLLALEAPIGEEATVMTINHIKKEYPGRKIKFVVPTHFHGDHAGGIREYMKRGAEIITVKEDTSFYEMIARSMHSISDGHFGTVKASYFFLENGIHRIQENDLEIIIANVGPTAHVKNNLAVYIPKYKIVFQGDMFRVPEPGSKPEPARKEGTQFLKKINELGWDIDIIVGTHGPVGSLKDLVEAVRLTNHF